jgi:hypothetical protein
MHIEPELGIKYNIQDERIASFINYPCGARHPDRVRKAAEQLNYFIEILESECV